MRKRTLAREIALQALYQLDLRGEEILSGLDEFFQTRTQDHSVINFAQSLFKGCRENQAKIDELIKKAVVNWEITRLSVIDRSILRLGTYEIIFRDDIPPAVSIDEAVELAKKYSARDSSAFVNGILDKVATTHKINMET